MTKTATPDRRPPKSAEIIADALRRKIACRELQPGEALPSESEMMRTFGVSRPTMREAFRILEAEQLIYVLRGPQGGGRVRFPAATAASRPVGMLLQLGGTTLRDVWEARLLIEPPLAQQVAERRDRDVISALRQCLERHHDTIHDPAAFGHVTAEFHDLVLRSAGNQTLQLLAEILDDIFHRHAQRVVEEHRSLGDQLQLNRAALRDHARLVELVEAGDGPRAEAAWRRHLQLSGRVMLEACGPTTVIDLYRP